MEIILFVVFVLEYSNNNKKELEIKSKCSGYGKNERNQDGGICEGEDGIIVFSEKKREHCKGSEKKALAHIKKKGNCAPFVKGERGTKTDIKPKIKKEIKVDFTKKEEETDAQ